MAKKEQNNQIAQYYISIQAVILLLVIAPLPETLLMRCQADESLLADILVKKFCDHLPLYRQTEMMAREGIYILVTAEYEKI